MSYLQERDAGIRRLVSLHRRPSGRRCCFSPQIVSVVGRGRQTQPMASIDHAQFASLVATVEETIAGVVELGERLDASGRSDAANALFEAERSLKMASRGLARARRYLGD